MEIFRRKLYKNMKATTTLEYDLDNEDDELAMKKAMKKRHGGPRGHRDGKARKKGSRDGKGKKGGPKGAE